MCIAIYKPLGLSVPQDYLEEGFASNPDGAGFASAAKGRLIVRKGFFTFREFMDTYEPYSSEACLIHFRIATSGGVNPQMCHPFMLAKNRLAMIHNGIIDIKPHKGKSDTATFADAVLTPLLNSGADVDTPALKYLVQTSIGKGNKILTMDALGKVTIFNEDSGHWNNGIWYSNYSYEPSKWTFASSSGWKSTSAFDLITSTPKTGNRLGLDRCEFCGNILDIEDLEMCEELLETTEEGMYCQDCLTEYQDDLAQLKN